MRTHFIFACLVLTSACAQVEKAPAKTSLEIQAIQSQMFTGSKKDTFNSVMSVLQDSGYIVNSASLETGFISAESPVKNCSSKYANLDNVLAVASTLYSLHNAINLKSYSPNAFKLGKSAHTEVKTAVTASVEELKASRTRVRLNFVDRHKTFALDGQRKTQDQEIHDVNVYQGTFEKIDQELFIRKS